MDEFFVLKYPDGKFVALDAASGGYPYPTENIRQTKFWNSAEEANKYRGVMNREGFTIHKVTLTIAPVQES